MYEKGKSKYKKLPTDFLRSRLCICHLGQRKTQTVPQTPIGHNGSGRSR